MGQQTYGDESNYQHDPGIKHFEDDKFEKNSTDRGWKKNTDISDEKKSDGTKKESDEDRLIRKFPSK